MMTNWRTFSVADLEAKELIARIVAASQDELLSKGVLGFRTLNVAKMAKCSASMIYRYFEDRTDLIVSVLSDVYQQMIFDYLTEASQVLEQMDSITPEFLLHLIPDLDTVEHSPNVRLWLMAISLSTENDKLKQAITAAIATQEQQWSRFFESVNAKLEPGWQIDLDVYQIFLRMHFLYYNSLFGEYRITDETYRSLMASLLVQGRPALQR